MHKLQLKKIKMWGVREILWKDHWWTYIYIYKLWNFDNRFLVGIKFKFLKFRCMLHVNFIKTLIVTLSKEIDKNK